MSSDRDYFYAAVSRRLMARFDGHAPPDSRHQSWAAALRGWILETAPDPEEFSLPKVRQWGRYRGCTPSAIDAIVRASQAAKLSPSIRRMDFVPPYPGPGWE